MAVTLEPAAVEWNQIFAGGAPLQWRAPSNLAPRDTRELIDQCAVDLRPETVDRWFVARRHAIDGAGLGDDGARDGEVAFRRQEFGDSVAPVGAQDGECRHQSIGAPIGHASDDEMIA